MTRNYNKGKIYKIEPICDHEEGEIYIGSTTKEYLSQRMVFHKGDYNKWKNGKHSNVTVYKIFEKYGFENCQIILIENVNANSKDELFSRESFYIRSMQCVNKYIPDRTKQEYSILYIEKNKEKLSEYHKDWYENNKESLCEKIKEYRNNNKEIISERKKEYNKINKEKIKEQKKTYYENNKEIISEKQKEYNEINKEKLKEKAKEYRNNNKEQIKEMDKIYREHNNEKLKEKKKEYYENNKEKIMCSCGCMVVKFNLKRHENSKKHLNFLSQ